MMLDEDFLSDENVAPYNNNNVGSSSVLLCPICKVKLPPNSNPYTIFKDPLPCSDCFNRFKRRRSSQPLNGRGRRNSDLGTISENSAQALDNKINSNNPSRHQVTCNYCPNPVILSPHGFINHLKTRHSAFGFEKEQIFYDFRNGCDKEHFGQAGTYLPDYIHQGGHYFLSQGCNENGVFHGWISMLGVNKEEAREFVATVTIYAQEQKGFFKFKKTPDLVWNLPVLPYKDEQPDATKDCYTIRWNQLKPYFQKNCSLKTGGKVKFTWSTRIAIYRR